MDLKNSKRKNRVWNLLASAQRTTQIFILRTLNFVDLLFRFVKIFFLTIDVNYEGMILYEIILVMKVIVEIYFYEYVYVK